MSYFPTIGINEILTEFIIELKSSNHFLQAHNVVESYSVRPQK